MISSFSFFRVSYIELPAKLLDYFLRSNKSSVNQPGIDLIKTIFVIFFNFCDFLHFCLQKSKQTTEKSWVGLVRATSFILHFVLNSFCFRRSDKFVWTRWRSNTCLKNTCTSGPVGRAQDF